MPRDDFSKRTKGDLAAAAGYYCVRCNERTHYFDLAKGRWIHVGNAAHDSAASPGGPRYDAELTPAQRKAYDNGAWLCATCATLVDADPASFPPGELSAMQRRAEERMRNEVHRPAPLAQATPKEAAEGASRFIRRAEAIRFDTTTGLEWQCITAIETLLRDARGLEPENELCAQHPMQVEQQQHILQSLRHLVKEVKESGAWHRDDFNAYVPQSLAFAPTEFRERVQRSVKIAQLHWNDVQRGLAELREFRRHGGRG
jgi:hypothetical protein